MSDFGQGRWIIGREQYRCTACVARIPKGEIHYHVKGMWKGEWQNWRMHQECFDDWDINGCGEFTSGDFQVPARLTAAGKQRDAAHI